MKKTKKIFALILIVATLCTCMIFAQAGTNGHSRSDAVAWANSKKGQSLDYDGVYGAQCVDLTAYYYQYLGASGYIGGNANAYQTRSIPGGWSRIPYQSGITFQPGDIAVWKTNLSWQNGYSTVSTGSLGHVGIILSADSVGFNAAEQNALGKQYVTINWHYNSELYCVIRPDFTSNQDPRGDLDFAYGGDGTVTVSGWAFDPDISSQSINVHIYVGGWAGQSGAESFSILANQASPDVNKAYGITGNHRFSATLKTSKVGTTKIYAYGINNVYGSNNPELWDSGRTVTISSKPSCAHAYVCSVTKKATFTQDGLMTYKCSKCGYVRETKPIAKVSNVYLNQTSGVYSGNAKYPSICVADSNHKALPCECYSATITNNVKIGTARVTVTLKGNYSGTTYLDYNIVPDKPANLKATAKTTSSLTLSWNKVPGAATYNIYYWDAGKNSYVYLGWVSGTAATINNVKEKSVTYAVTAVANGKASKMATVKGGAKPAAPELTITARDQKAYLKWNAVPGASKYNIYCKAGSNSDYKKLGTTTNLSATVTGIPVGKTVYFRLLAVKTIDGNTIYSSYSQAKSVRF